MRASMTANGEEVGGPEHVYLGHQERLREPWHSVHHAQSPRQHRGVQGCLKTIICVIYLRVSGYLSEIIYNFYFAGDAPSSAADSDGGSGSGGGGGGDACPLLAVQHTWYCSSNISDTSSHPGTFFFSRRTDRPTVLFLSGNFRSDGRKCLASSCRLFYRVFLFVFSRAINFLFYFSFFSRSCLVSDAVDETPRKFYFIRRTVCRPVWLPGRLDVH